MFLMDLSVVEIEIKIIIWLWIWLAVDNFAPYHQGICTYSEYFLTNLLD